MKLVDYVLKNSRKRDRNLKYDFMPALLEVIEKPSHVAGNVIIIAISALLVFFIVWANLARIDVVVSGSGYITTQAGEGVVTAGTSGTVKAVYVSYGDMVEKGQTLLELDTTQAELEMEQIKARLGLLRTQKDVAEKLLADLNSQIDASDYPAEHRYAVNNLIYSNEQVKQNIQNYPSGADAIKLEYEAGLNEMLYEITQNISAYENELLIRETELRKFTVKAPVTGCVLQAEKLYTGQNILSNSQLFVIVPGNSQYVFRAYIDNKDISEISLGDVVEIKLSAYSYSDYGSIEGKLVYISPSVVTTEGGQRAYEIQVEIDKEHCHKDIELLSGMSGLVEVKVGKRSVMDYFLEPVIGSLDKSLKEK